MDSQYFLKDFYRSWDRQGARLYNLFTLFPYDGAFFSKPSVWTKRLVITLNLQDPIALSPPQKVENSARKTIPQEFFFTLPLPGERGTLELRGRIDPAKSKAEVIEHAKALEKKGDRLPPALRRTLEWLKKAWQMLEKSSEYIAKGLGGPIKYLGLALLVAGSIHIFVVLGSVAPLLFAAGGLTHLIVTLVTSGAIPTTLAGGSLYFFGKSLLKGETPSLHNFLNGFPIISYFMTLLPSNYSPTDPHQQT